MIPVKYPKMSAIMSLVVIMGIPVLASAFDPAVHFEKECAGCHSIGQGDGVGPDLKGVAQRRPRDWLSSFIISADALLKKGDPIAKEITTKWSMVMPDQALSHEEAEAILDFIETPPASGTATDMKLVSSATKKDVQQGEDLFLGRSRISSGAPACVACHAAGEVGGGSFAIDLTKVASRYEEKALTQALKKPGFRVMKDVYSEKPLNDDEAFALKAFLYEVSQAGVDGVNSQNRFVILGAGGCLVLLLLTHLIWKRRRKNRSGPRRGGQV